MIQTVEAYNPTADRWKEIGTLPKPRRHHATCLINGKLWSCGGASSLLEAQSTDELMFENQLFFIIYIYSSSCFSFLVLLIRVRMNGDVR